MYKYRSFWLIICLLGVGFSAHAKPTSVSSVRLFAHVDKTRVVFDVSKRPVYNMFTLANPHRLVIDIQNARLARKSQLSSDNHPLISRIRSAKKAKGKLRVVLDLKDAISSRSFTLSPNKSLGHRLVVDIVPKNPKFLAQQYKHNNKTVSAKKSLKNIKRDVVIAIDAGHGGKDTGAIGPKGTREKDVVFKIAKKLESMINRKPGMKAVLIRKGDYYVKLRDRMKLARKAKADLFVSIHADAFKDSQVKGASVFMVSRKGASSEAARWLANKENSVEKELVGGVGLRGRDKQVQTVIIDLAVTATNEASRKVGDKVLKQIKHAGHHLHQDKVQKAGFVVLKAPDIPSILVETAFISNPGEERKLGSEKYQYKIASSVYRGIYGYFKNNAPADTFLAHLQEQKLQSKHVIARGETLSEIAVRYGVSMKAIKHVNSLAGNMVKIGQVLTIPAGS